MSDDIKLKERACPIPAPPELPKEPEQDSEPLPGLIEPPVPQPSPQMSLVCVLDEPLWRVRNWMKILGVLLIINGILSALTIWGIVLCWLPIWLGITLFSAANHVQGAAEMDDPAVMKVALTKIALFFKISGISIIVWLGIAILLGVLMVLGIVGPAVMVQPAFP